MAVYFIRPVGMTGPVKIGCSGTPETRLQYLMTWSPFPLEIVAVIKEGDLKLERRLHGIFAADHTQREWFKTSFRLDDLIRRLAAGEPIGSIVDLGGNVLPFRLRASGVRFSPEMRRYLSYKHRLQWAYRQFWKPVEKSARFKPDDVDDIISNWYSGDEPSAVELARLEEVIRDPQKHVLTARQKWPPEPKKASAA